MRSYQEKLTLADIPTADLSRGRTASRMSELESKVLTAISDGIENCKYHGTLYLTAQEAQLLDPLLSAKGYRLVQMERASSSTFKCGLHWEEKATNDEQR